VVRTHHHGTTLTGTRRREAAPTPSEASRQGIAERQTSPITARPQWMLLSQGPLSFLASASLREPCFRELAKPTKRWSAVHHGDSSISGQLSVDHAQARLQRPGSRKLNLTRILSPKPGLYGCPQVFPITRMVSSVFPSFESLSIPDEHGRPPPPMWFHTRDIDALATRASCTHSLCMPRLQ
jgi:hypothetical protein